MTTFQTYQQVGIKEDISDIISNISPTKTPFQSMISKEKVHNTLFQWQEDSLRAVAVNAKVEGADPTDVTVDPTSLRTNYTQIFTESVKVAGTADVVSTYGRAKEMAYQMAKSAAQVKRDLEHALIGYSNAAVAGTSAVARETASAWTMITGNSSTATGADFDEADITTVLQAVYSDGADPSVIMVTPANSIVVAGFGQASGRYRVVTGPGDRKGVVTNVVNLYVSPFGEQKVVLNRFELANYTLIFDPAQWALCTLRPWMRETLAKTGDATRMMIVGEFGLKHKNYAASGYIVDNA